MFFTHISYSLPIKVNNYVYIHKRGVLTLCVVENTNITNCSLGLKILLSLPCDIVCQNTIFTKVHGVRFLFSLDITDLPVDLY